MDHQTNLFKRNTIVLISLLILGLLIILVTLSGILAPQFTYETQETRLTYLPNDWVNLVLGLPLLLTCLWAARREKIFGVLTLPGVLVYIIYTYFNYLIPLTDRPLFPAYLFILVISVYTLITWVSLINPEPVFKNMHGKAPARISAAILIFLGFFNLLRQGSLVISSVLNHHPVDVITTTVWINDLLVVCPMLIIGGFFLWFKKPFGYLSGPGLLFQYALLAFSVIPVLVYQSIAAGTPLDVEAIIAVGTMALICFVPYLLFLRGIKN